METTRCLRTEFPRLRSIQGRQGKAYGASPDSLHHEGQRRFREFTRVLLRSCERISWRDLRSRRGRKAERATELRLRMFGPLPIERIGGDWWLRRYEILQFLGCSLKRPSYPACDVLIASLPK